MIGPCYGCNRGNHCRTRGYSGCGCTVCVPSLLSAFELWAQQVRALAASLVNQHTTQTGPQPGDPFDANLWMAEAAELLELVTRFGMTPTQMRDAP